MTANVLSATEADHGVLIPTVRCASDPAQSYAVYLPPGYSSSRLWPILYCFDPMAHGRLPVERFMPAAEALGYIVVGSNNSRNGDVDISARAASALLRDTGQRLSIDPQRRYAAGFSGGARLACTIAREQGLAGVVASGAGFPGGETPAEVSFAFFGVVGREDMNYLELRGIQEDLRLRPTPHRTAIFEGRHEWLPATLAAQALEWMDAQAMRAGSMPRNNVWLREIFRHRFEATQAQTVVGHAYEEGVELLADFKGLTDTAQLETWLANQGKSKLVRRYLKDEKKSQKQEAEWRERFAVAISVARRGLPEPEIDRFRADSPLFANERRDWPTSRRDGAAEDRPDEFGAARNRPEMLRMPPRETDALALLHRVVQDVRRQWDRNAGARRALYAVSLNLREHAERNFILKEYDDAGKVLELAIILQPEERGAYFNLAWVRAMQGHRDEAQSQLGNATRRGFNDEQKILELTRAIDRSDQGAALLEPMFITEKRQISSSFGLGLTILADPATRALVQILITETAPGSQAEARSLGLGEEILRVNGRSVRSFQADFSPSGDFARLFSKRKNGDTIDLEILDKPDGKPRTVTLTQGLSNDESRLPWLRPEFGQ